MSTLGERIRMVRKAQSPKMSQTVFAESLGATQKMQTTYESDTVPPDKTYQKLLCLIYHINPLWLETGEGEMAAAEASAPCNTVPYRQAVHDQPPLVHSKPSIEGLDKLTLRAVNQFLQLPQETRAQLFRMMKAIVSDETDDE